jgi:hypothetical protein
MELNFVDLPPVRGRGRSSVIDWAPIIEELYKHPNKWILAPYTLVNSAQGYRIPRKYANIEIVMRNGNNLRKDDPDKKNWEVYLRYVPEDDTF